MGLDHHRYSKRGTLSARCACDMGQISMEGDYAAGLWVHHPDAIVVALWVIKDKLPGPILTPFGMRVVERCKVVMRIGVIDVDVALDAKCMTIRINAQRLMTR